ncbi:suppressor of fused domain protein [Variovorax sp. H27-G14]|uniref:suppressor of fused domain protein n=1 Tax=Variovorax sp. H27-G14 TaxID=3111914 RepID=UPI0038FC2B56
MPSAIRFSFFESATAEGTLLSTVGLMDVNISATSERELRTEVLLDHRGHASQEANVLATIAFYVLKNGWRPSPGVVFEEMLTFYLPDGPLPHVLFIPPYQWADSSMTRATVGDLTIYPLLAVPISELERLFVSTQGYEQLQAMWEERQTDVLDWTRAGTI